MSDDFVAGAKQSWGTSREIVAKKNKDTLQDIRRKTVESNRDFEESPSAQAAEQLDLEAHMSFEPPNYIDYDEFQVVYQQMVSEAKVPATKEQVKAQWTQLDNDRQASVAADKFFRFMWVRMKELGISY